MAEAIAPLCGYNTPKKQEYREDVWNVLFPAWERAKGDSRAHVLIMPSREGLEIDLLVSLGIPEEKIIAVDRSAAVIATSVWRKTHPKVKFFAAEIGDVWKKINANGYVIACANLDFCSNFSQQFVSQASSFLQNVMRFGFFRFALTVAKGREGAALTLMLKKYSSETSNLITEPRLACFWALSGIKGYGFCDEGKYTSGKNPMAWGCFEALEADEEQMRNSHVQEMVRRLSPLAAKGADDKNLDEEFQLCVDEFAQQHKNWTLKKKPLEKKYSSEFLHDGWDLSKGRPNIITENVLGEAKNVAWRVASGLDPQPVKQGKKRPLRYIVLNA